jgi:hypothetical protein
MISVVALLVSCGSSSSSVSPDGADVAAGPPADSNGGARDGSVEVDGRCTPVTSCGATDSNGNARDANGDVDGDCTPATAFTCVASCTSAVPAPLICDDGHWECERGVDSRQCAAAGT